MKKVYLVKKDPSQPESKDNWIVMNSREFAMFLKTPEGQTRKKNFGQLNGCDEDDVIIIAECGEESAIEWKRERDRSDYCDRNKQSSPFAFFSVDAKNEKGLDGVGILADPACNVELEIILKISIEELRKAVSKLSDDERELIQRLFLDEEPVPERVYGEQRGLSQQAVNNRKARILEKLKKMLDG